MRPDIKKVICEKERSGDRSYMGGRKGYEKEHRFRHEEDREDYGDLESLPKKESMTRRLGYEKRSFSENLGVLRGLIKKNEGKNWDKLYSQICKQVSPTGTNIERHVHQHLPDFIYIQTRMGEKGVEVMTYRTWEPVDEESSFRRCEYFVHPKTRCITKLKKKRQRQRAPAPKLTIEGPDGGIRYAQLKGIWFELVLEPAQYTVSTLLDGTKLTSTLPNKRDVALEEIKAELAAISPYGRWNSRSPGTTWAYYVNTPDRVKAYGADLVCVRKRALNHKELKRLGVANAQAA